MLTFKQLAICHVFFPQRFTKLSRDLIAPASSFTHRASSRHAENNYACERKYLASTRWQRRQHVDICAGSTNTGCAFYKFLQARAKDHRLYLHKTFELSDCLLESHYCPRHNGMFSWSGHAISGSKHFVKMYRTILLSEDYLSQEWTWSINIIGLMVPGLWETLGALILHFKTSELDTPSIKIDTDNKERDMFLLQYFKARYWKIIIS